WSFPDGQKVSRMWNAEHSVSGTTVTARNVGWNGSVAAGSSVGFGFTGEWSGSNGEPASFSLGGESCAAG
ncbi:cellulose-binding domain-containing protein, partial [Streptomyces sp. TRM76130]|nr:cellulose-binding domain-containing protein [Streptomyces sp. TRM76130]